MSARRVLMAAALLALVPAAAARAQESGSQPVVGGGSYNDAPLLAPGRYHDTIRPGERLFYAFFVKGGQQLHLKAEVRGDGSHLPADLLALGVSTPLRDVDLDSPERDLTGKGTFVLYSGAQLDYVKRAVGTFADTADAVTQIYRGPGAWFVSLDLRSGADQPLPVEVPVDLEVAVEGTAQPEPRADRTPAPAPSATASAAPGQQESSGGSGTGLAIAGLVGLLAGLLLAVLTRWRGSRRRLA